MFQASISKSKENVSKYILSQVPLLNLNSLKVLFSHQNIFAVKEIFMLVFQKKSCKISEINGISMKEIDMRLVAVKI